MLRRKLKMSELEDFPKLESPFERMEINGKYVVIPKLKPEYLWILDKDTVIATEKFDGTNCSVLVEDGKIKVVMNRKNRIDIWKSHKMYYDGIKRAIDEKKFQLERLKDGQYFGELIGEKINGNPYRLEGHLFLPFEYIKKHYLFKFYYDWLDEEIDLQKITHKEVYYKFSELFYNLKSLYFRKFKEDKAPEGIVFWNRETGEKCKLRIDMFDWYKGKPHKWYEQNG